MVLSVFCFYFIHSYKIFLVVLDTNVSPTMQVRSVGESAKFQCDLFNRKLIWVEWYWNNSTFLKAIPGCLSCFPRSLYLIQTITREHAGIFECRANYYVGNGKDFITSAHGELRVTGMYLNKQILSC